MKVPKEIRDALQTVGEAAYHIPSTNTIVKHMGAVGEISIWLDSLEAEEPPVAEETVTMHKIGSGHYCRSCMLYIANLGAICDRSEDTNFPASDCPACERCGQ